MKIYFNSQFETLYSTEELKSKLIQIFKQVETDKPFTFTNEHYENRIDFVNAYPNESDYMILMEEMLDYDAMWHDDINEAYFSPALNSYKECYQDLTSFYDERCSTIIAGTDFSYDTFYCDKCEARFFGSNYTRTADGHIVHDDVLEDLFYSDFANAYYLFEDNLPYEDNECYLDSYHSKNSIYKELDENLACSFMVGFEAEKEDLDIKEYCNISDFHNETDDLWRKESDSSLDNESGFELISPFMKLNADKIVEYLESSQILKAHINADSSKACGGHVHLSNQYKSGSELYDMLSGYFPILLAMYRGRIRNSYSAAGSKDQMKSNSRMAINVKSDRIEIRVFSAIKNTRQLHFRLALLQFICENPTDDFKQALGNVKSQFKKLFGTVYTKEQFNSMLTRAEVYSVDFEFATSQEIEN